MDRDRRMYETRKALILCAVFALCVLWITATYYILR